MLETREFIVLGKSVVLCKDAANYLSTQKMGFLGSLLAAHIKCY